MIAWSYTRLSDFEACPYRFKLKYIDKKSEAPSPAAERGTLIHKQYEDFMTSPALLSSSLQNLPTSKNSNLGT